MEFKLATKALGAKSKGAAMLLEIEDVATQAKSSLECDTILVATGRRPYTAGLGLKELGVAQDPQGRVTIDQHFRTKIPGIYAIGDIAGPPWLAHKASHEGVHCIEHIAGLKPANLTAPIPGCTYSNPQIASVGLTEAAAKAAGYEPKVGRFPFRVNGKAVAAGEVEAASRS